MPFIEIAPQIKLFVEDQGEGFPLLFLHGWPFDHQLFTFLAPFLSNCRLISVDLRGYGKSDRPDPLYTYDHFAHDLTKILDYLDLKQVTLVGFSMGGAIALHHLHHYPSERITKLALIGATAPCYVKKPDYPFGFDSSSVERFRRASLEDHPLLLRHFLTQFFFQKNAHTQQLSQWLYQIGQKASIHAIQISLSQMQNVDLRPALSHIGIPTAIFHGRHDQICPFALGEQLHVGIKNSHMVIFEKSGHGLFFEETEKFCEKLLQFVHI